MFQRLALVSLLVYSVFAGGALAQRVWWDPSLPPPPPPEPVDLRDEAKQIQQGLHRAYELVTVAQKPLDDINLMFLGVDVSPPTSDLKEAVFLPSSFWGEFGIAHLHYFRVSPETRHGWVEVESAVVFQNGTLRIRGGVEIVLGTLFVPGEKDYSFAFWNESVLFVAELQPEPRITKFLPSRFFFRESTPTLTSVEPRGTMPVVWARLRSSR
ncbi:MAG: hypothetical protein AAB634_00190 [Patescibacteria group bacterium]